MEYRLDLNTLLLMLRQSTGSLHSEIQHMPGVKGRCQAFLRLEKGLIKTCAIKNGYGEEIFSGEAAIKHIQGQVLEWHYREEQPLPRVSQETSSYGAPERPPRLPQAPRSHSYILNRRYSIPQSTFLTWPRLYRSVYSLIDGKTSVDEIVRLLGHEQGTEKVLDAIAHLQWEGLIVFG